ncbi:MAG: stage III sporulation protein AF [Bacillota bacterium]|nr:stage III sporulation protein AF [Bacillota bacterium]
MDILKQWVSNLFIIILALTFIELLLPDTSMGKYLKFIFSLVIMATILYPIIYLMGEY